MTTGAKKTRSSLVSTQKEKASFREVLRGLLDRPASMFATMSAADYADVPGVTNREAVAAAVLRKALDGDMRAFEIMRDTLGEKSADKQAPVSGEVVVTWRA